MSRILIIEDDTDINNMMAEALRKAGYECTQAFSGTEGLLYIERDAFDLAVLDLMLPGMNGEALLPQIKAKQNVPVIVVSAKDSIDSKVGLLTSGAEDYLTKPFDIQEFIARVGVQIRRFAGKGEKSPDGHSDVLSYRELELHTDSYTASVGGQPVELTRQEFKILELLCIHAGKVLTYDFILEHVWGPYGSSSNQILRVNMANIRRKLKENPSEPKYVLTELGIGYRMLED